MKPVNIAERAQKISEYWRPEVIATANGQEVKLARFKGEFVWHRHDNEDEIFVGVSGHFRIEYRDSIVDVGPGELAVVARGTEHRTVAEEEATAMLIEPAGVRNTGNVYHPTLTAPLTT